MTGKVDASATFCVRCNMCYPLIQRSNGGVFVAQVPGNRLIRMKDTTTYHLPPTGYHLTLELMLYKSAVSGHKMTNGTVSSCSLAKIAKTCSMFAGEENNMPSEARSICHGHGKKQVDIPQLNPLEVDVQVRVHLQGQRVLVLLDQS